MNFCCHQPKKHLDEFHFVLDFLKCHSVCTKTWEVVLLGFCLFCKLKCFLTLYTRISNHTILLLRYERMAILKTLLKNDFICFSLALSFPKEHERTWTPVLMTSVLSLSWQQCKPFMQLQDQGDTPFSMRTVPVPWETCQLEQAHSWSFQCVQRNVVQPIHTHVKMPAAWTEDNLH